MSRRVAVLQMNSSPSIEQNLRQASDLIVQARLSGASFVCLPEAFDYMVDDPSYALSLAATNSNPLLSRYHAMSSQSGLWLSLGGMHMLAPQDESRMCSVHMVISPDQQFAPVATYRKLHVLDEPHASVPSEALNTLGGSDIVMVRDTPIGNVGLTIGHDMYFPSLFESLRGEGAHVILMPNAMPLSRGLAHWHSIVRARAIESQCYTIAAAQVGHHSHLSQSFGHSSIVKPDGTQVVDAGQDGINFVCADIDLDLVYQVRDYLPLRKQRRDDIFGKVALSGRSPNA